MVAATKSTNNEDNANSTSVMRMLAQLNTVYVLTSGLNHIKSLNAHTPHQLLSRPTNVPPTMPTTHIVTMSLSQDNVSIKTQKYANFQRFCHAISAAFSQKATD